jgi:hypothetical protein
LRDQVLENVVIIVETESDALEYELCIPIPRLNYDETQTVYVAYEIPVDIYPIGKL